MGKGHFWHTTKTSSRTRLFPVFNNDLLDTIHKILRLFADDANYRKVNTIEDAEMH